MHELDLPPPGQAATRWIRSLRGPKNPLDPRKSYGMEVETELGTDGRIESVLNVLLTNRECPWTCLMCDLWVNTLDDVAPPGAIAEQIQHAVEAHPGTDAIKLYNAGSFFDKKAIPPSDHADIATHVQAFRRVVVESHPALVGEACLHWQERIGGGLEVAMGLETVHPDVLPRLNKGMDIDDFARASKFLAAQEIGTRAFILVRPPFLSDAEGVEWAIRSVAFARESGIECIVLIPARGGNGAMETLASSGAFAPPSLNSLEDAFDAALTMGGGRSFVDLWDTGAMDSCSACGSARLQRLARMNQSQSVEDRVRCPECGKNR